MGGEGKFDIEVDSEMAGGDDLGQLESELGGNVCVGYDVVTGEESKLLRCCVLSGRKFPSQLTFRFVKI